MSHITTPLAVQNRWLHNSGERVQHKISM